MLDPRWKELLGAGWQTKLARLLNVDSRTVRRWVSGERAIPQWVADLDPDEVISRAALKHETEIDRDDDQVTFRFFWGDAPLWEITYDLAGIPPEEVAWTVKAMGREARDKVLACQALGADFAALVGEGTSQEMIDDFICAANEFWASSKM